MLPAPQFGCQNILWEMLLGRGGSEGLTLELLKVRAELGPSGETFLEQRCCGEQSLVELPTNPSGKPLTLLASATAGASSRSRQELEETFTAGG